MKSLLVVACLFLVAMGVRGSVEEEMAKMAELSQEHIDACYAEFHIQPEDEAKFHMELEGDDRIKIGCTRACWMKRIGALEDGKIDLDKMKEFMEKVLADTPEEVPKRMEMLAACMDEVKDKTDECEMGYEFATCCMKQMKDA